MNTNRRHLLTLAGAALALPALRPALAQPSAAPPRTGYVPIDLGTGRPPYRLDVASIEIVDKYQPPFQSPNVEHQFAEPPARLAARWATQRLVAVGTERVARFVINQASVIEVQLEKTSGLRGLFTTDQDRRYDGKLSVAIEIASFGGLVEARVDSTASSSKSLSEKATLDDRDALFDEIDRELIRLVEGELDKSMPLYFAKYLR